VEAEEALKSLALVEAEEDSHSVLLRVPKLLVFQVAIALAAMMGLASYRQEVQH